MYVRWLCQNSHRQQHGRVGRTGTRRAAMPTNADMWHAAGHPMPCATEARQYTVCTTTDDKLTVSPKQSRTALVPGLALQVTCQTCLYNKQVRAQQEPCLRKVGFALLLKRDGRGGQQQWSEPPWPPFHPEVFELNCTQASRPPSLPQHCRCGSGRSLSCTQSRTTPPCHHHPGPTYMRPLLLGPCPGGAGNAPVRETRAPHAQPGSGAA